MTEEKLGEYLAAYEANNSEDSPTSILAHPAMADVARFEKDVLEDTVVVDGTSRSLFGWVTVLLGDKQEAEKYKQYNKDHVPDIVQAGASAWRTDWLGETKVPSSLTAHAPEPGCLAVGHLVGLGNTEEGLHRVILGCRQRGAAEERPFDHTTGEGRVPFPSNESDWASLADLAEEVDDARLDAALLMRNKASLGTP